MESNSSRVEVLDREVALIKHRVQTLEQEQLPRRVAVMEPAVQRMEQKIDELSDQVEKGLKEVKEAIIAQKAFQKAVVAVVLAVVGLVQFLPYIKVLLT